MQKIYIPLKGKLDFVAGLEVLHEQYQIFILCHDSHRYRLKIEIQYPFICEDFCTNTHIAHSFHSCIIKVVIWVTSKERNLINRFAFMDLNTHLSGTVTLLHMASFIQ